MTFYLILSFSVFFISLIGTKLVILTLKNRPTTPNIDLLLGKRKAPTPANGGIAVVFAIIIGLLGTEVNSVYKIIPSIFLLTGLPLLSSIMPFPRTIKLAARLAAIIISIGVFPSPIFSDLLPPLFDKILAVFFWLWIIHSFDKLEKVDGLLPVQMITIGAGLSAITILSEAFFSDLSIQALVFTMAGVGFLWWNHYPAKVFAGEIASVPAGFVGGYLLLLASSHVYFEAALIIPAYFLADSFITFFNRPFSEKLDREQKPTAQPLYCLRAIRKSKAPQWVIRTITGINMLLIFLEAQILISPQMLIFNLIIAYAMVFTLVWYFARMARK